MVTLLLSMEIDPHMKYLLLKKSINDIKNCLTLNLEPAYKHIKYKLN